MNNYVQDDIIYVVTALIFCIIHCILTNDDMFTAFGEYFILPLHNEREWKRRAREKESKNE